MAKTSTTQISVQTLGDGVKSTNEPAAMTNTAAPSGGPVAVALAVGANTIAVPSGAKGMVIIPPTGSSNVKTLKGVAGDTGFALRNDAPSMLALPDGTSSVHINSVAIETVQVHWV